MNVSLSPLNILKAVCAVRLLVESLICGRTERQGELMFLDFIPLSKPVCTVC